MSKIKKSEYYMNNSFYVYSNSPLIIERMHICTWDIKGAKSKMEIGLEIVNDKTSPLQNPVQISLSMPFSLKDLKVKSLHNELCEEKYSQYIFNDIIKSSDIIDEDAKRGKVLHFKERGYLAVLPVETVVPQDGNILNLTISPSGIKDNIYVRLIMDLDVATVAIVKDGIAKRSLIFDFKINESRNMPDSLVTKIKSSDLLEVKQVFLFHAVPDSYNIDFYDSNKFKSIRKLETEVFADYTGIEELRNDEYMILFNKDTGKKAYSFYTCFSDEIIGTKQIVLAIGANILCSLLFSLPSFRNSWNCYDSWAAQFPWEWIFALLILIAMFVIIFL